MVGGLLTYGQLKNKFQCQAIRKIFFELLRNRIVQDLYLQQTLFFKASI